MAKASRARHGCFLTVEGIEGAGKTTCLATIERHLAAAGIAATVTREPGGTRLGEALRAILLDPDTGDVHPDAETLMMFAARSQHLHEVIRPALARGNWVICDRFTDATYAYQGAGRGVGEQRVAALESWTQGEFRPDLTIFLDVPPQEGLGRAASRSRPDRFERERVAFFDAARASYLARARQEPDRVRVIDASRPLEAVQGAIRALLDETLTTTDE